MIKVRPPLEKKRIKEAISLAAFGGLIVALLIGFMVMMKESECGSYGQRIWR
jgi:hypothetical protein